MAMQIYCRDKYANTTKESNILETLRKIQGETEKQYKGKETRQSYPSTQKCLEKDCSCKKKREIEL